MLMNQPPVKDLPGQEQTPADNGQDQQVFEDMVAGITEFMFGKGKADIANQLASAKDLPTTIGQIAFTLVMSGVDQAKQAGKELDMDMVLGVAAECIDSLIRMVGALKLQAPPEDQLREQAMIVAVQSYLQSANPTPEEQAAAQQMLAQMHADGTTEQGAAELQGIGQRAGVDPFAEAGQGGGVTAPEAQAPPAGAGMMEG